MLTRSTSRTCPSWRYLLLDERLPLKPCPASSSKPTLGRKTKEGEQDGRKTLCQKELQTCRHYSGLLLHTRQCSSRSHTEEDEKSEHGSAAKIPPRRKTKGQGPSTTAYRAMKKVQEMRKQMPPRF